MNTTTDIFKHQYGPWGLVTGASDGIGRDFARELAAKGLNLVLVARRKDRLESLATELESTYHVRVVCQPVDLANADDCEHLLRSVEHLEIGLLVAAAGFGTSGLSIHTDPDMEADLVQVNCRAVLQQSLHFSRLMVKRKRGGLILISSVLAFQGTPFSANYAASKAYIQSLAEGLSVELKPFGIDVLAVAPGPVASGFSQRANMDLGKTMSSEVVARASVAALGRRTFIRPGWLSKLLGWSLSTAPRFVRVFIIGNLMKKMSGVRIGAQ